MKVGRSPLVANHMRFNNDHYYKKFPKKFPDFYKFLPEKDKILIPLDSAETPTLMSKSPPGCPPADLCQTGEEAFDCGQKCLGYMLSYPSSWKQVAFWGPWSWNDWCMVAKGKIDPSNHPFSGYFPPDAIEHMGIGLWPAYYGPIAEAFQSMGPGSFNPSTEIPAGLFVVFDTPDLQWPGVDPAKQWMTNCIISLVGEKYLYVGEGGFSQYLTWEHWLRMSAGEFTASGGGQPNDFYQAPIQKYKDWVQPYKVYMQVRALYDLPWTNGLKGFDGYVAHVFNTTPSAIKFFDESLCLDPFTGEPW